MLHAARGWEVTRVVETGGDGVGLGGEVAMPHVRRPRPDIRPGLKEQLEASFLAILCRHMQGDPPILNSNTCTRGIAPTG